jgi:hypothetical protein
MPRQYSAQFRQRVLGLVNEGRNVGGMAPFFGPIVRRVVLQALTRRGLVGSVGALPITWA